MLIRNWPAHRKLGSAWRAVLSHAPGRIGSVSARWRACMTKSGYDYGTPIDALSDSRWAPGTSNPTTQRATRRLQLAVATADARCQQQVNLAGVRLAVLASHQDELIQVHLGQFLTYERQVARLVATYG